MSDFNYETFKEFKEEWGEPDSLNLGISIGKPDQRGGIEGWSISIAQVSKDHIETILIRKATNKQIKEYMKKCIKIIQDEVNE